MKNIVRLIAFFAISLVVVLFICIEKPVNATSNEAPDGLAIVTIDDASYVQLNDVKGKYQLKDSNIGKCGLHLYDYDLKHESVSMDISITTINTTEYFEYQYYKDIILPKIKQWLH